MLDAVGELQRMHFAGPECPRHDFFALRFAKMRQLTGVADGPNITAFKGIVFS